MRRCRRDLDAQKNGVKQQPFHDSVLKWFCLTSTGVRKKLHEMCSRVLAMNSLRDVTRTSV